MKKAPGKEPHFRICRGARNCVALDCLTVSSAAEADDLLPPREVTFPIRPLIVQRGTVLRCYPLHSVPVWIEPPGFTGVGSWMPKPLSRQGLSARGYAVLQYGLILVKHIDHFKHYSFQ